jgi:hypothetical protein
MAKLFVTEFEQMPETTGGRVAVGLAPPAVDQTPVVIGAGSLQSAAFGARAKFVRLHTDVICSIAFGTNPTATINTMRMAANQTEYFGVAVGDKVAVIANT